MKARAWAYIHYWNSSENQVHILIYVCTMYIEPNWYYLLGIEQLREREKKPRVYLFILLLFVCTHLSIPYHTIRCTHQCNYIRMMCTFLHEYTWNHNCLRHRTSRHPSLSSSSSTNDQIHTSVRCISIIRIYHIGIA